MMITIMMKDDWPRADEKEDDEMLVINHIPPLYIDQRLETINNVVIIE